MEKTKVLGPKYVDLVTPKYEGFIRFWVPMVGDFAAHLHMRIFS